MTRASRIFVAMPNDGGSEVIWDRALRPAIEALSIDPVRVRTSAPSGGILPAICNEIDRTDALIALVLERNAHVYLEVGYALARKMRCLIITDQPQIAGFFAGPADVHMIQGALGDDARHVRDAIRQMLSGNALSTAT